MKHEFPRGNSLSRGPIDASQRLGQGSHAHAARCIESHFGQDGSRGYETVTCRNDVHIEKAERV